MFLFLLLVINIFLRLFAASEIESGGTDLEAINWNNPMIRECFDNDIFKIYNFKSFCVRVCEWRPGSQRTIESVLDYLGNGEGLPAIMDEGTRMGVYKLIRKGQINGGWWLESKIVMEAMDEPELFANLLRLIAKENGLPRHRLIELVNRMTVIPRDKLIEFKKFENYQMKIIATLAGYWTLTTLAVMFYNNEMEVKELTGAFVTAYILYYLVFFYFYGNYKRINLPLLTE